MCGLLLFHPYSFRSTVCKTDKKTFDWNLLSFCKKSCNFAYYSQFPLHWQCYTAVTTRILLQAYAQYLVFRNNATALQRVCSTSFILTQFIIDCTLNVYYKICWTSSHIFNKHNQMYLSFYTAQRLSKFYLWQSLGLPLCRYGTKQKLLVENDTLLWLHIIGYYFPNSSKMGGVTLSPETQRQITSQHQMQTGLMGHRVLRYHSDVKWDKEKCML